MSSIDNIVDVEHFSNWLCLETNSSKQYLKNNLKEWVSDKNTLKSTSRRFHHFKEVIQQNPDFLVKCTHIFKEIKECEACIDKLCNTDSQLEKESYKELLFFSPYLQTLNFVPYLLSIWAFLRVYFLPAISFVVPFLTLLAPYFLLRFAFNLPITFQNYMNILHSMMSGQFGKLLDPSAQVSISPSAFFKQFGIVLFTFIQGVIQPYWSYKHLHSIDTIVKEKGTILTRFRALYVELYELLENYGITFYKCPLPEISDNREGTARAIFQSPYFKLSLKYIGSLEVIVKLASKKSIIPVKWVDSNKPVFSITDTFDYNVPENKQKVFSISFTRDSHALLTGPNKGGKSTVLRALSLSSLLAHTYGCAIGKDCQMSPFSKLFVCLKPDDLPGTKSRFEREIDFTANTIKESRPCLIFIDELYHSTNPPDALRACNIYSDKLWKKDKDISVISTHLFEFVERAPSTIYRFCCPAKEVGDSVEFLYGLEEGVCKVSSVNELLKENGLYCD
jgi:hypothetical protein